MSSSSSSTLKLVLRIPTFFFFAFRGKMSSRTFSQRAEGGEHRVGADLKERLLAADAGPAQSRKSVFKSRW
jgi:hypothetical protein